jgi:desulfoferrodoxin (superoxide reductase-like protein)
MKRAVLIFSIIIQVGSQGLAHPPVKVRLSFHKETHTLAVELPHHVNDVEKHYILKIEVKLNEKRIVTQNFKQQTELKKHMVHYVIPSAKKGDVIEVTASCNQYGNRTQQLTLE